jgi:hypothetical protein
VNIYSEEKRGNTYFCCLGSGSPGAFANQGKTIINVIPVFLTAKTLLMDRTLLRISDGISDQQQGKAYHECMQLEHKAEPSHDREWSEQLLAKEYRY